MTTEMGALAMKQAVPDTEGSPPSPGEDRVALLAAEAQKGGRDAFGQLVELYHEEIFRMIYYRTRSRMDAEDLAQDVFVKAYRNLPGLKDTSRFRTWLYSIAVNRVRDFFRWRKLRLYYTPPENDELPEQPADGELQNDPAPLDDLLGREFWDRMREHAKVLSKWEREIFFLRFLDQLSLPEIARVINKSESAVKTHLYRALKKFKENEELREYLQGAAS